MVRWITVLASGQVLVDDVLEGSIIQQTVKQPIQQRRRARNACSQDHTTFSHDPIRFSPGCQPILVCGQMIQRSQQEDTIDTASRKRQLACIPDC
jgi:hypothetical protein